MELVCRYTVDMLGGGLITIVVPLVPGSAVQCCVTLFPCCGSVCTDDPGQAPHLHA